MATSTAPVPLVMQIPHPESPVENFLIEECLMEIIILSGQREICEHASASSPLSPGRVSVDRGVSPLDKRHWRVRPHLSPLGGSLCCKNIRESRTACVG